MDHLSFKTWRTTQELNGVELTCMLVEAELQSCRTVSPISQKPDCFSHFLKTNNLVGLNFF